MCHSSSIPVSWLSHPPQTLVVGEGPYARALRLVLGAAIIGADDLSVGIREPEEGGSPLVLRDLERVLIVAAASQSAADLVSCHDALWRWIKELSPAGEQHEGAILFALPHSSGNAFAESLAVGLGIEKLEPEEGLAVARMGDSLESLCRVLSAIRPCDLPPLRARQAGNARHTAIRQLIEAATVEDLDQAARNAAECFSGQEYHFDLFCRPPSHRNGNQLRQWLRTSVTAGVTPESAETARNNLAEWIRTE